MTTPEPDKQQLLLLRPRTLVAAVLLLSGMASAPGWAQDGLPSEAAHHSGPPMRQQPYQPLTFSASYALQSDDNLLRLPNNGAMPPDPTREAADRIGVGSLGLRFHTVQGLQELDVTANLVNYQYSENSALNFTARNYDAAWRWFVTPRLHGNLTALQQERPTSSDPANSSSPNQQMQTSYRADAAYDFLGGSWQVLAGLSHAKLRMQYPVTPGQEYSSDTVDGGLRMGFGGGSFVKATLKTTRGKYLHSLATLTNATTTPQAADLDFDQQDADLRANWAITTATTADSFITHIQRTHPRFARRNFSGNHWGAGLAWAASAKSALSLRFLHELGAYETPNSNYSETDHLSWGWSWNATSKTQLHIGQELAQVAYRGSPFGLPASKRQDTLRDTSMTVRWQLHRQWQLATTLRQTSRAVNQPGLDYHSNQASIAGQFTY
ncbi:MAG: hypothetical protein ORN28_07640 [Rhodoferax sp.]|nr:hypothetical protein [Rhodoferax sp.]